MYKVMWKERITDLAIYAVVILISYAIGSLISHALGGDEAMKVLAPTISPQADPFFEYITS